MGRPKKWCQVDACGRDAVGWEMCKMHWQRWKKWGDPRVTGSRWSESEHDRFWKYVDKTPTCWLWTGATKNGYGTFWINANNTSKMVMAHKYAYGDTSEGMTLDHLCHTEVVPDCQEGENCEHRRCVRPDHLQPVDLLTNIRRGGNAAKTHCKRGHEFTEPNTYITTAGGRSCRACAGLRRSSS